MWSARSLFDGIRVKDVISWNAMIAGMLCLHRHEFLCYDSICLVQYE